MEVMGGLIRLDQPGILPIPWYMRSYLGLETGSKVWYAATEPADELRLPDIIVSPLDPRDFHEIRSVTLSHPEGVGTVAEILKNIGGAINIALADSVTLEKRDRHRINLILERGGGGTVEYKKALDDFVNLYSSQDRYELSDMPLGSEPTEVIQPKRVPVSEGQIRIGSLLSIISEKYAHIADQFDFSRVVTSSSPDQRLVRYIIPKKGVITLRVEHEDRPGVLHRLVRSISDHDFNILCSRLSRARPDVSDAESSTFVCEIEPGKNSASPDKLVKDLEEDRAIYKCNYNHGVRTRDTLYPKPKNSITISPEDNLISSIDLLKNNLEGRRSVFISRRFIEMKEGIPEEIKNLYSKILREVRDGALAAGWEPQEAPPNKPDREIDQAVYPALWLSDAFLILAFFDDGTAILSPNQAMELGFGRGQRKSTAVLIESSKIPEFNVSNYAGRQYLDYNISMAFERQDEDSIFSKIKRWLTDISRSLDE